MNPLPKGFTQNILSLFPEEAGYFFESLSKPFVSSVRLNTLKPSAAFAADEVVEWCQNARYLIVRPSFIEDPLLHAGAYYVQESSSMFLDALIRNLPIPENALALDLCAAPGGKSTLLLNALPQSSLLVSNEIIKSRVGVLQENIIRWGAVNSVITNNDPKHFQKLGEVFDLIVVDAPCSGEGLWRRDPKAMDEWNEENIALCVGRQERILQDILPCLKPGGFLIYSTCTFNELENEKQVQQLISSSNVEAYPIQIPATWPVYSVDQFQFRFLPHKVKGEGLFMAVLKKPFEADTSNKFQKRSSLNFVPKKILPQIHPWFETPLAFDYFMENDFVYAFPKNSIPHYEWVRTNMYVKHAGICMGKLDKAGKLIPEHSLALANGLNQTITRWEMDKETALLYLKRANIAAPSGIAEGWCLATYQGLALGWAKILPNRVNNYFPAEYRILKDIQEA